MAAKPALNTKNLAELGPERLAELLMRLATGDAAAKRLLRLELAGSQSSSAAAAEVRKRLASIGRAKSYVDWRKQKSFAADLNAQRLAIVERIAPKDPPEALALLVEFLMLFQRVHQRVSDGQGLIADSFEAAMADLVQLAPNNAEPKWLALKLFGLLEVNSLGQFDGLITVLGPTLGEVGLANLKQHILDHAKTIKPRAGRVLDYSEEFERRQQERLIRSALLEIADLTGDTDAFIAQYDEKAKTMPEVAAAIGERLLKAGQLPQALQAIDAAKSTPNRPLTLAWQEVRADCLEALGRLDDAQAFRLTCFHQGLLASHLRAYLKKLPDFDDLIAEKAALDQALEHNHPMAALQFFLDWPALEHASRLVISHRQNWNGDHYYLLTPAADALQSKYPLAATILRRAMIDFALTHARSKRYKHAAQHLQECTIAATSISDFGDLPEHEAYAAALHAKHARKHGFWAQVDG